MPSAEIITIGTEILLGEIVDTNSRHIACLLRDAGIDLYRTTTVGDNAGRIAALLREALARCDIIITTGGLGPTVDDPTREAVAQAFGVELVYRPELWEQIQARFARYGRPPTENNRKQAYIPQGAIAVENPVGTAPSFIVEDGAKSVIALPGVPSEMEFLMEHAVLPYLRQRYGLHEVIKTRVLHTAGVGESQIDDLIGDLERLSNPTVGLAAHSGQVDVRIAAKAGSEEEADRMIHQVEEDLRRRLKNWIYGVDGETLEGCALRALEQRGWRLAVVEAGLGGLLLGRLTSLPGPIAGGEVLTSLPSPEELLATVGEYRQARLAEAGLGVVLHPGKEKQDIYLVLITPDGVQQYHRPYGGPPAYGPRWAVNHSLNLIRNL